MTELDKLNKDFMQAGCRYTKLLYQKKDIKVTLYDTMSKKIKEEDRNLTKDPGHL